MYKVPNQKILAIHKQPISYENKFLQVDKQTLFAAMKILSGGELKLWLYLSSQSDTSGEYSWILSRWHVLEETGLSRTTYLSAVKALCKKGYLIHLKGDYYAFYEIQQRVPEMSTPEKEKLKRVSKADTQGVPDISIQRVPDSDTDNKTSNKTINNTNIPPDGVASNGETASRINEKLEEYKHVEPHTWLADEVKPQGGHISPVSAIYLSSAITTQQINDCINEVQRIYDTEEDNGKIYYAVPQLIVNKFYSPEYLKWVAETTKSQGFQNFVSNANDFKIQQEYIAQLSI